MKNKNVNNDNLYIEYEKLISKTQKPGRYSGGEYNSYLKQYDNLKYCLCFPDVYEVGMSNLGIKILYHMINEKTRFFAERCFTPWVDFGKDLEDADLPLFSLESRTPLKDFDVISFSIGFEMCYTNILYMLKLGGVPLLRKDRSENDPLVFLGGVCTVNPQPLCDFVDFVYVGEGEVSLETILDMIEKGKESGKSKNEILESLNQLDAIYVPAFSTEIFDENGVYKGLTDGKIIKKDYVKDLDASYYPANVVVPNIEIVHNRAVLELFRGCARGCRFCQAGFCYRPIRAKKVDTLVDLAKKTIKETGFEEMSLNSLSSSDFPNLEDLIGKLKDLCWDKRVKLSLPSLRLDNFKSQYVEKSRKSSLTFAPEAGTQRLRDVVNKNITEEDIQNGLTKAFESGYTSVKLYFMIGLPTETMEDVEAIFALALKVKEIYRNVTRKKDVRISVSVANFVPKPFTPFMWVAQDTASMFTEKHTRLKELFYHSGINLSYHDSFVSKLEALFALGGMKLSNLLLTAFEKGCIYDSWNDQFQEDKWKEALVECGIDLEKETSGFDPAARLSWDHIDVGVSNDYFKKEYDLSFEGKTTKDCLDSCNGCGKNIAGDCKKCW